MFEIEAEKWVKENMDCCKTDNSVNQSISYFDEEERCCAKSAFQDGAEFGYNKANEWHYVKDGNLPKENQLVLLYRENKNGANIALTYWYKSYVKDKVIAWKEIVLPKDSE